MKLRKFKKWFLILSLAMFLSVPTILAFHFSEMKNKSDTFNFVIFSIISVAIIIAALIAVARYNRDASYKAKMNEMWRDIADQPFLKMVLNATIFRGVPQEHHKLYLKIVILLIIIFILINFFNA